MQVETKIDPLYAGKEKNTPPLEMNQVSVRSHKYGNYIVIGFRGISVTVDADELKLAIDNAVRKSL